MITYETSGAVMVCERTEDDKTGQIMRRNIVPGSWVGGVWVATSLASEADPVKRLADKLWTDKSVKDFMSEGRPQG